jgi:hypothetical protein
MLLNIKYWIISKLILIITDTIKKWHNYLTNKKFSTRITMKQNFIIITVTTLLLTLSSYGDSCRNNIKKFWERYDGLSIFEQGLPDENGYYNKLALEGLKIQLPFLELGAKK